MITVGHPVVFAVGILGIYMHTHCMLTVFFSGLEDVLHYFLTNLALSLIKLLLLIPPPLTNSQQIVNI